MTKSEKIKYIDYFLKNNVLNEEQGEIEYYQGRTKKDPHGIERELWKEQFRKNMNSIKVKINGIIHPISYRRYKSIRNTQKAQSSLADEYSKHLDKGHGVSSAMRRMNNPAPKKYKKQTGNFDTDLNRYMSKEKGMYHKEGINYGMLTKKGKRKRSYMIDSLAKEYEKNPTDNSFYIEGFTMVHETKKGTLIEIGNWIKEHMASEIKLYGKDNVRSRMKGYRAGIFVRTSVIDKLKNPIAKKKKSSNAFKLPTRNGKLYTYQLGELNEVSFVINKEGLKHNSKKITIKGKGFNTRVIATEDDKNIIIAPINLKEVLK